MNWSLPNSTAPSNAEDLYKKMCGRNGVNVALVSHGGSEQAKTIVENSVVDPTNWDIERTGSILHCNESVVDPHESDFAPSGRCVEGNGRDVNCIESIVDETFHVTGDVAHTILQLGTLTRKMFAQHYQPGRKSIFTPATLLENPESDKGDETHILEDDKI